MTLLVAKKFPQAPWSDETGTQTGICRFQAQFEFLVATEQARLRAALSKRQRRPRRTPVVGYLIGDDSTMVKKKGRKIAGLGLHHSTTEGKRVKGHRLVLGMYLSYPSDHCKNRSEQMRSSLKASVYKEPARRFQDRSTAMNAGKSGKFGTHCNQHQRRNALLSDFCGDLRDTSVTRFSDGPLKQR